MNVALREERLDRPDKNNTGHSAFSDNFRIIDEARLKREQYGGGSCRGSRMFGNKQPVDDDDDGGGGGGGDCGVDDDDDNDNDYDELDLLIHEESPYTYGPPHA